MVCELCSSDTYPAKNSVQWSHSIRVKPVNTPENCPKQTQNKVTGGGDWGKDREICIESNCSKCDFPPYM